MKKLNTEIFIEKAKLVHNNKYDYSLVDYKTTRIPIKIICPNCGEFEILPHSHLQGIGCRKCNILNKEKFIEMSNKKHNHKYNYDNVDNVDNNKTKVIIKCNKHDCFEQEVRAHLAGQGCPKCYREQKTFSKDKFITQANIKHNNIYDYSLVEYENNKNKIKIICKKHGIFEQNAGHHLNGSKCPKCMRIINTENFIFKANEKHNNLYDYSNTIYINNKTKVTINCKKHGEFKQSPMSHLQGIGCPYCISSKGEIEIVNFLNKYEIKYERQKKFTNCKNKRLLPFDFFIDNIKMCIEYNGIQHYKSIDHFGGIEKLKYTQNNDNIKKKYCNENNINLLIIRYNDNITEKLTKYLKL